MLMDFLETAANFEVSLSYLCSAPEINKKWLLLPQKLKVSKNLLSSVITKSVTQQLRVLLREGRPCVVVTLRH
jgi:hypothetical protein